MTRPLISPGRVSESKVPGLGGLRNVRGTAFESWREIKLEKLPDELPGEPPASTEKVGRVRVEESIEGFDLMMPLGGWWSTSTAFCVPRSFGGLLDTASI